MVKNKVAEIAEDIRKKTELTVPGDRPPSLALFFSFDISNSSEYKSREYLRWSKIIVSIFEEIKTTVGRRIAGSDLWRILGDEIVFVKTVFDQKALIDCIEGVYEILTLFIKRLDNGSFFKELCEMYNLEGFIGEISNILSLKATAWVTVIKESISYDNPDSPYHTIRHTFRNTEKFQIIEFLGNDMDTGFRLSKLVCSGYLVLSFELAYMLFHTINADVRSRMNIITYAPLKGIWDKQLYPIIWYFDAETHALEDALHYNELATNSLVREYVENQKQLRLGNYVNGLSSLFYKIDKQFFDRIANNRHLLKKLEYLNGLYCDEALVKQGNSLIKPENPSLVIHVAAICYAIIDNEINIMFVFKQKHNSNHGAWEFGCAKLENGKDIIRQTEEFYKLTFKIDIEIFTDKNRSDNQPIPLAIYQTPKEHENGVGIIVLAKINGDIPKNVSSEKYSKICSVSKLEWEKNKNEYTPTVDDFHATLEKAFKIISENEGV